jgi:hypothetical protein
MDGLKRNMSIHGLKTSLLAALESASPRPLNKFNLIGRPHQRGDLENRLGLEFNGQERSLAAKAFDELRSDDSIEPTYSDVVAPEDWVVITDTGRDALKRGTLDDLDEVLQRINPYLARVRRGAWAALGSAHPDSLRQAAHSARELIDQVLKEGAPDAEIRREAGFRPDPGSLSGITRRMRLKVLMRKYRGEVSESDVKVIEESGDLLLAMDDKLKAMAHNRAALPQVDVRQSLEIAEMMLWRLLVSRPR